MVARHRTNEALQQDLCRKFDSPIKTRIANL
jgi:hypothetical protein